MSSTRLAVLLMGCMILPGALLAAPGDVLFSDEFNGKDLAPWSTSDPSVSGILTGGQTSASNPRSGYTSARAVTVTGPVINTSVPGASLSVWIRRGSDSFSGGTDTNEDFVIEYLRATGDWASLKTYLGSGIDGQIYTDFFVLPNDALHSGFRLRFRQTSGSGPESAFWHFDDVIVTEIAQPAPLAIGSCEEFEGGLGNWTVVAAGGQAAINNATFDSPSNSLSLSGGAVSVTSTIIDTSAPGFSDLTVWIRRGANNFSDKPERNENLVIEYRDELGSFVQIESFSGGQSPGQVFDRRYTLPEAGRHPNFQLRIRQLAGSGMGSDFWHIDDVCLEDVEIPQLQISKLVRTLSDPVNGIDMPKSIPGAIVEYTVTVSNQGLGVVDANSLAISDPLPPDAELFVDSTFGAPIRFVDGSTSSGLDFDYSSDIQFSDQPGGTPNGYSPIPGADGFDPNVTGFELSLTGEMAASDGINNPGFSIRFLVRIRSD